MRLTSRPATMPHPVSTKGRPLVVLVLFFTLLHLPTRANGQQPPLSAGTPIGIRTAAPSTGEAWLMGVGGPWSTVELVEVTADSLRFVSEGSTKVVPLKGLDVGLQGNRRWAGFAVGVAVGAIAGGVIGASTNPGDEFVQYDPDVECAGFFGPCTGSRGRVATRQVNSPTDDIVGGLVLGGLAGGALGWAVGQGIKRWRAIPIEELLVTPSSVAVSLEVP